MGISVLTRLSQIWKVEQTTGHEQLSAPASSSTSTPEIADAQARLASVLLGDVSDRLSRVRTVVVADPLIADDVQDFQLIASLVTSIGARLSSIFPSESGPQPFSTYHRTLIIPIMGALALSLGEKSENLAFRAMQLALWSVGQQEALAAEHPEDSFNGTILRGRSSVSDSMQTADLQTLSRAWEDEVGVEVVNVRETTQNDPRRAFLELLQGMSTYYVNEAVRLGQDHLQNSLLYYELAANTLELVKRLPTTESPGALQNWLVRQHEVLQAKVSDMQRQAGIDRATPAARSLLPATAAELLTAWAVQRSLSGPDTRPYESVEGVHDLVHQRQLSFLQQTLGDDIQILPHTTTEGTIRYAVVNALTLSPMCVIDFEDGQMHVHSGRLDENYSGRLVRNIYQKIPVDALPILVSRIDPQNVAGVRQVHFHFLQADPNPALMMRRSLLPVTIMYGVDSSGQFVRMDPMTPNTVLDVEGVAHLIGGNGHGSGSSGSSAAGTPQSGTPNGAANGPLPQTSASVNAPALNLASVQSPRASRPRVRRQSAVASTQSHRSLTRSHFYPGARVARNIVRASVYT